MSYDPHVEIQELGNTYVSRGNRFVVSLLVGYGGDEDPNITDAETAAAAALALTRDEGSYGTQWYVFDRETGVLHMIEQRDIEEKADWLP